jgi:uncharacterized cupredoxin-like copper-binding protein
VARGVVISAVMLVAVAAACNVTAPAADTHRDSTAVSVIESEWKIVVSPSRVSAGSIVFRVKNRGRASHDLVVLKTNLSPKKLLPKGRLRPMEPGRVGQTRVLGPGKTLTLRLTLKPAHYLLICSLVGHLRLGMHTDFTVR